MARFSASRARFSAGDRSLSVATASSGLCMRSLSWCLRSALAVRMGAASPEYGGTSLRSKPGAAVSSGTSPRTDRCLTSQDELPSHGAGPLLRPEAVLQGIPIRRKKPSHTHTHTHISRITTDINENPAGSYPELPLDLCGVP